MSNARHVRNKSRQEPAFMRAIRNQDRRASRIAKKERQRLIEQDRALEMLRIQHELLMEQYREYV